MGARMAPPVAPTKPESANESMAMRSTEMPMSWAALRSQAQASMALPWMERL